MVYVVFECLCRSGEVDALPAQLARLGACLPTHFVTLCEEGNVVRVCTASAVVDVVASVWSPPRYGW